MPSGRTKLVIVLLITLSYRATSNMLQTSVPLYAKYVLHESDFIVSMIVAIAQVAVIASLLYLGYSHIGVGKSIFASLLFTSLCIPLFIITQNVLSLTVVTLFANFWIGTLMPLLLTTVVLISSPGSIDRNLAIFSATLSFSLVLSPIYQGALLAATNNDLVSSMLFFAPLMAAATALFILLMRSGTSLKAVRGKFELVFVRSSLYWMGILAYESFNFPFIAILTFGGIFAKRNFGASYSTIEAIFTAFFLTSLLVRLLLVRLSTIDEPVMLLSFAAMAVALPLTAFSSNLSEFALSFVLLGYSHAAGYPVAARYIAKAVTNEGLMAAYTVASLIDASVIIFATPIIGIVAQLLGLSDMFLMIEVPVFAIGITYALIMRRVER
jgi:DHA1 family multidrug resistance protein-like MFS transporter